jgi:plastocyanin
MAISERRRLTFTVIAVVLLAGITGLLLINALLPFTPVAITPEPGTTMLTLTPGPGEVAIMDFQFIPSIATVVVGTTITWTNIGRAEHTVDSDIALFESGLLWPGDSFSYTFTQLGIFYYLCLAHGDMPGRVHVIAE